MKEYYKVLGLKPGASLQEIKTAYRKLSKKFHPDVNQGDSFFEERFKEIQEAYEKLSNESYQYSYEKSEEPKSTYQPPEPPKPKPPKEETQAPKDQNSTKSTKAPESSGNTLSKIGWFALIAVTSIIIKQAIKSNNNSSSTESTTESVAPYQENYSIPASLPEETKAIDWNQTSFFNCTFQIPENLQLQDSYSSGNQRLYVDNDLNTAITINAEELGEDKLNASVEDYAETLQTFAEAVNENNKQNFNDFVLLDYKISNFGNEKAIEIKQSSTKVSGKGIEMTVMSYYIISAPYFYTINLTYPRESNDLETLNKIMDGFAFEKSKPILKKQDDSVSYYDNGDFSFLKTIHFSQGQASFPRDAFPELQYVVTLLKKNAFAYVKIEGHTDSDGTDYENMKLSENRAAAVKNYLIENGISADKLICEGFGETQPKSTNYTDAGKIDNNRVEVKIYDVN